MIRSSAIQSRAHLDVARTSIEIEVAALDVAEIKKFVHDVFLGRLFVHVGHDNDPSLYGC